MQALKRMTLPLAAALALVAPAAAQPASGAPTALGSAGELAKRDRTCSQTSERVMKLARRIYALRDRITRARVRLRNAQQRLRAVEGTDAEPAARERVRKRRRALRALLRDHDHAERRLKELTEVLERKCS